MRVPPLILLDIDGVLNPTVQLDQLVLPAQRAALVRELADLGEIVWATTWSAAHTWRLGQQLGLPGDTEAIAFPPQLHRDGRNPDPTPKLHWVSRWLSRNLWEPIDWSRALVWIDDHLMADAHEWADELARPTLLISPRATSGLERSHVEQVRAFVEEHSADLPDRERRP